MITLLWEPLGWKVTMYTPGERASILSRLHKQNMGESHPPIENQNAHTKRSDICSTSHDLSDMTSTRGQQRSSLLSSSLQRRTFTLLLFFIKTRKKIQGGLTWKTWNYVWHCAVHMLPTQYLVNVKFLSICRINSAE